MNLNINKDEPIINDFLYCWDVFKKRPNKVSLHSTYSTKLIKDLISFKEENKFTEIITDEEYIINEKVLSKISDNIYLSYVCVDKTQESSIITDLVFFYKENEDISDIEMLINKISECIVDFEEESMNKINTVTVTKGTLEIEPINMSIDLESIELYYNSNTLKSVNSAIKKIKKNNSGITILHGDRGTGKTSIINYISSKIDRILIYLPTNMLENTLNNPEFNNFLKRFSNPILIIDDCEFVFNDAFSGGNVLSNNILQMVEGLNKTDVNIIMIYNSNVDEVDSNLIDSNSILDVVNFEYLSKEEANEISKSIGTKKKYKNKIKIGDITRRSNLLTDRKIGFL